MEQQLHSFINNFVPEPNSGCWLWTGTIFRNGYGRMNFGYRGSGRGAHRVAWELYHGHVPEGMCVLHRCDTKLCVNPDHLFLGTSADNCMDRHAKGRTRTSSGEAHGSAKLTADQVLEIREGKGTLNEMASRFGVSFSVVGQIRRNEIWRAA